MFQLRPELAYDWTNFGVLCEIATCNSYKKTGHYERLCRGRKAVGEGLVGLIHENGAEWDIYQDQDERTSQYKTSVG